MDGSKLVSPDRVMNVDKLIGIMACKVTYLYMNYWPPIGARAIWDEIFKKIKYGWLAERECIYPKVVRLL